jgi:hypothetical protein
MALQSRQRPLSLHRTLYSASLLIVWFQRHAFVHCKIDRNVQHGHRGKLQPYLPGPFQGMQLSQEDERTLTTGSPVMKQTIPKDGSTGGAAICVQDVQAPLQAVWYQILDMDHYTSKVKKVIGCQNYHVQTQADQTIRFKTKQVLGVLPGYSVRSVCFWGN